MRHRAGWQTLADDRNLEVMNDEDRPLNATDLKNLINADYSKQHLRRRCKKLQNEGLLMRTHPDNATYVITDEGRAYLNEEYDVATGQYLDDEGGVTGGIQEGANGETGL